MINPLTVGPLALTAVLWWQGENDHAGGFAEYYRTSFPALVRDWREKFALPHLPFVTVLLESWARPWDNGTGIAVIRGEQLRAADTIAGVHIVTALDIGDPNSPYGNVHPRDKRRVGDRMAATIIRHCFPDSAAAQRDIHTRLRPPSLISMKLVEQQGIAYELVFGDVAATAQPSAFSPVTLALRPMTELETEIMANASLPTTSPDFASGFAVTMPDGRRIAATAVTVAAQQNAIIVRVPEVGTVVYGRAGWVLPLVVDTGSGLPIDPF